MPQVEDGPASVTRGQGHRQGGRYAALLICLVAGCLALLLLAAAGSAQAALQNPGLEADANGDSIPDCWRTAGYGTNSYQFIRTADAHSGGWGERVQISSLSSGDRKLITTFDSGACAQPAVPGHRYQLSGWYKGDSPTEFVVYLRNSSGSWSYWTSSSRLAASSSWNQATWRTPAVPTGATHMSFGLSLAQVGTLTTDDYGLSDADATPPDTTITDGPPDTTSATDASFSFTSSEPQSTFVCTLDGAQGPCTSPKTYSSLPVGQHTFTVAAVDSAGNTDPTPATKSWTVVAPPGPVTGSAKDVSQNSATLTGTVNPNGQATTYHFEYGTSTAYGSQTSDQDAGSGTGDVGAQASISGLSDGTTYHYRLVATNASGTTNGSDATFTTPPSAYASALEATSGLVSYWRLGESSGPSASDSKGANNGAYQGGYRLGEPGALAGDPNTAVKLDGSSGYVDVPNSAALNIAGSLTLEAWVKFRSGGTARTWQAVLAKGDSAYRLHRYGNSNRVAFGTSGLSNLDLPSNSTLVFDGNWHYLAATWDGTTKSLYVDGQLDAQAPASGTLATDSYDLRIGENSQQAGRFWDGWIDEPAVYGAALSATTIQQHYNLGKGNPGSSFSEGFDQGQPGFGDLWGGPWYFNTAHPPGWVGDADTAYVYSRATDRPTNAGYVTDPNTSQQNWYTTNTFPGPITRVEADVKPDGWGPGVASQGSWSGFKFYLRRQGAKDGVDVYTVEFYIYDGSIHIQKKCVGIQDPGNPLAVDVTSIGTWYLLAEKKGLPIVNGVWHHFEGRAEDNPDGSVTLHLVRDGQELLTATDRSGLTGCAPLHDGHVGWRSNNARYYIDDFKASTP